MTRAFILLFACLAFHAHAGSENSYTFSWPLDGEQSKPRGGTTRGAPVALDTEPSAAWKALQQTGIDAFERDRRAILAMAGAYRVTFDFLEIVRFDPQPEISAQAQAPYRSWGTEKIYVDVDSGEFISLVHILEMRVVQKDGSISEPFVTKHWRQDWRYRPDSIVAYRGRDRWQRTALKSEPGVWSQTVYQVDESPRYASVGRWQHSAVASTWLSGETWRPLPRREWSVRDDYHALIGTNRHTVTATGWVHEENNLKAVLDARRELDAATPYRAREYGVARYERIRDPSLTHSDFANADDYFARTRAFWDEVRDTWAAAFAKHRTLTLRGPVDKLGLFQPLFARADELAEKPDNSAAHDAADNLTTNNPTTDNATTDNAAIIDSALAAMGVPRRTGAQ